MPESAIINLLLLMTIRSINFIAKALVQSSTGRLQLLDPRRVTILPKIPRCDRRFCRPAASASPVELSEAVSVRDDRLLQLRTPMLSGMPTSLRPQDIEFLSTLGGQVSSASSTTPKQDATASLIAAAEGLGSFERIADTASTSSSNSTVEVRFCSGRLLAGDFRDSAVLLKVYPKKSGSHADLLIRNEVAAHTSLQQLFLGTKVPGSERISHLLGYLTRDSGEQVLVFRTEGLVSVEQYCCEAAEMLRTEQPGTPADQGNALRKRKAFVKAIMVQILEGLAFMHRRERVHQRLEPRNIVLMRGHQESPELLRVQLQDLALSADISDAALLGGATLAEIWQGKKEREDPLKALAEPLWERAKQAGAESSREQQLFAVSEDILSAGLLVAYLAFVPFCLPGSIDFAAIQRLLGVTFQAEMGAAREYCEADERWQEAVAFLNEDIGSGWDLIQSMIFPDYKLRPTADSCLNHPFLKTQ